MNQAKDSLLLGMLSCQIVSQYHSKVNSLRVFAVQFLPAPPNLAMIQTQSPSQFCCQDVLVFSSFSSYLYHRQRIDLFLEEPRVIFLLGFVPQF